MGTFKKAINNTTQPEKRKKCNSNIVFLHTIFEKNTKMTRSFAKIHHHPKNPDQNFISNLQNLSYQQNNNCKINKTTRIQDYEIYKNHACTVFYLRPSG